MAQGSDGAVSFRRELKNGRRISGESGGRKLRRDHKNWSGDIASAGARCQPILFAGISARKIDIDRLTNALC
jgi:hypothetical protein